MKLPSISRKRYFTSALVIIGLLMTVNLGQLIGLRGSYQELYQQSTHHLNNLISYIENTLGRFEKVPEVLSKHPLLQQVLITPQNETQRQQLNLLLEEIAAVTQASDIYLIDKNGITLAASNWHLATSFVGNDYHVRPYFRQAIAGDRGRYYAIGLSSDKRGYYFAYPVMHNKEILGVITVKVSIDDIESHHKETVGENNYNFLIVAPDDVVFISDREEWRLKTIGPLSPEKEAALIASKRYAGREIDALSTKTVNSVFLPPNLKANIYQLNNGGKKERVFAQKMHMADVNWQVHIWSSLAPINRQKSILTVLSISGYLLVLFLVLFTKERLRNARHLRQARSLLEQRVKERTTDLTASNNQLLAEIQQRKQMEQKLKDTQDELLQSAKLAVIGNMSASINHEINQPLTALRSYSQNALLYQERGMSDKVANNLKLMIGLIDRVADIVSQFKNFTKKSAGLQSPILVQECIEAALSIIKHQAQSESVSIVCDISEEQLYTLGDDVRLEQVFVNLFSNAIQAMAECADKSLNIHLSKRAALNQSNGEEKIIISIHDSGPGILEGNLDKIFEPFFTTKDSFGLGLGLSISDRIIESMQGKLLVNNHPNGGAEFTILLPVHHLTKDA